MLTGFVKDDFSAGFYLLDKSCQTRAVSCAHKTLWLMGLFFKDEESWLDRVLRGEDVCSGFYGRRGEFSRNDEAYRVSDDIRQFHRSHPDVDLSDHYYWDDLRDAETDGYLED